MNNLSKTLFIPFYFKYLESIGEKTLYEKEAVSFFSKEENKNILPFSVIAKDNNSFCGVLARTKIIDNYLLKLLKEKKIDNIFNIGCGLDFKNRRLEIEKPWFNIDLDSVIKFRMEHFPSAKFEKNISADILKSKEWDFIPFGHNIFILEGILMYFPEEIVYTIIENLKAKSEKSYFIIETMPEELSTMKHKSVNAIDNDIHFEWGVNNIEDVAKKGKLNLLHSTRYIDLFQERWKLTENNSPFEKKMKENCRTSLFESL